MSAAITNDQFREYMQKWSFLINSTVRKFSNQLNEHDLSSCSHWALYKCMIKWDAARNVKFSSLLVNYLNWECQRLISKQFKYGREKTIDFTAKISYSHQLIDLFNSLPELESEMLTDRYINKLTLKEMGRKYKMTYEGIRKKLLRIRQKLLDEEMAGE